MTPEQRASHARELLANPLLQALVADVQRDCVGRMAYLEPDAHNARLMHISEWRALEALMAAIASEANRITERPAKTVA